MATIYDQYGHEVRSTRKLIHASSRSYARGPQFPVQNKGINELVTEYDRDVIIGLSQRLFYNMGAFRSVVDQKATYSVGHAWLPNYKGSDIDAGMQVSDWLKTSFYQNCDVRGGLWDFWRNLTTVSYEMDVRGDSFTLLTEDENGMPKIKTIPAHAIKTKNADQFGISMGQAKVKSGEFEGYRITYGIIFDDNDKAVAYRVSTGPKDEDYQDIDAASIIHIYDSDLKDTDRGLPVASHALEDLKHMLQSTEYERTRQLILSTIGLIVENEIGGPDINDPRNYITAATANDANSETLTTQQLGPHIQYMEGGKGNKIHQLKHEAGGDTFESFHDRMIRSFVAGAKWSYSLTWKPTGQGTAERGEILRARKAIEARQKLLAKWALRVITYAYAIENRAGRLPDLESPFAWEFTKPPRLSVDDGREHKMLVEGFRLGKDNMSDLLEYEGRTYDEHIKIRAEEAVKRKTILQQIEKDTGFVIDERELVTFQASQPESQQNDQSTTE